MIWKVWVAAPRWQNNVKSRAQRPRGLFNRRKLFLSVLKILPNELEWILSWHTNAKNCRKGLHGASRWIALENRRKITSREPRWAFPSSKINYKGSKNTSESARLVLSWHTNSTNLFLSVIKTLTNTVVLFSNRHMHLRNFSKGFNGVSGLWRLKSVGKVLQNHVVCEILTNLLTH